MLLLVLLVLLLSWNRVVRRSYLEGVSWFSR
jgi:hypothetical protein